MNGNQNLIMRSIVVTKEANKGHLIIQDEKNVIFAYWILMP